MKRRDKEGNQLYKSLTIRVFLSNGARRTRKLRAKDGMGWHSKGIEEFLEKLFEELERDYPYDEFKLIEISPTQFNFVYTRKKETVMYNNV